MKLICGFDLETELVQPGYPAPAIAAGVVAVGDSSERLLTIAQVRDEIPALAARPDVVLAGANIAYDFGVLAHDGVKRGVDLLPTIFDLYETGRVHDICVAQALDAIANGHLFKDPRTGGELVDPGSGERKGRYTLAICTDLMLGRKDAKQDDFWRRRYAILAQLPFSDWPEEALEYLRRDGRNSAQVAAAQLGLYPRPRQHEFVSNAAGDGFTCKHCAAPVTFETMPPCTSALLPPLRNIHEVPVQSYTAFCMHLSSMWGVPVNPQKIAVLRADAERRQAEAISKFTAIGFIRGAGIKGKKEGTEDQAAVKRACAIAYGATADCRVCEGTGKVPSEKTGNPINCKTCNGTGLNLSSAPTLPISEVGNISCSRDTFTESGDETLMAYADLEEKTLSTYLPALEKGIKHPIYFRPNVLIYSGRASYDGVIQLFPRDGTIREVVEASKGRILCSTDYSALELCTLAQSCLWIVGRSKMAEIINETGNPGGLHTAFAAKMLGIAFAEMARRIKAGDKQAKDFRQAAKAFNFGKPGGMGTARFVIAKRNRAEGKTVAANGTIYTGIRFCILIDGAEACGVEKVTEWKGRPNPPMCKHCARLVEKLGAEWLALFDEMPAYFNYISQRVDANGELTQFVSNRVRGGLSFCDGANTIFQGLGGDIGKAALRMVTRESYIDRESVLFQATNRIINFPHDELISEMDLDLAHLAGPRQAAVMIEAAKLYCPDVKFVVEPALMHCWTKKAEPVYDATGKLIPWVPCEPCAGTGKLSGVKCLACGGKGSN